MVSCQTFPLQFDHSFLIGEKETQENRSELAFARVVQVIGYIEEKPLKKDSVRCSIRRLLPARLQECLKCSQATDHAYMLAIMSM